MPSIRQMFPSKWLQPEDLPKDKTTPVTIAEIGVVDIKNPALANPDEGPGYYIRFHELRKPLKLKSGLARNISDALRTDITEQWIGRRIGIFPTVASFYGKPTPVIACSLDVPLDQPALTGPAMDKRPIGESAAGRFVLRLKEAGKTTDDFFRYLKANVPGGIELVFGVEVSEWPGGLLPTMKAYLDEVLGGGAKDQGGAASGSVSGEVIDKTTGEVSSAAQRAAAATGLKTASQMLGGKPPPAAIDDDEIPF